jgi:hypothetical protein
MEKGIPHTTCELVVVALRESGPGLLQCLDTLMIAETNIDFAYALLPNPGGHSMLAMHVKRRRTMNSQWPSCTRADSN